MDSNTTNVKVKQRCFGDANLILPNSNTTNVKVKHPSLGTDEGTILIQIQPMLRLNRCKLFEKIKPHKFKYNQC